MIGGIISAIVCTMAYFNAATKNMNDYNKRKEAFEKGETIYREYDSLKQRAVETNEVVYEKPVKNGKVNVVQYIGDRSGRVYKVRDIRKEKEQNIANYYKKENERLRALGKQYIWIRWERWDRDDNIAYAKMDLVNEKLIYDVRSYGAKYYILYADENSNFKSTRDPENNKDVFDQRMLTKEEYNKYFSI